MIQRNAFFWEMDCLEAVERSRPIGVGPKESRREALITEFGARMVEKAIRAWGRLLRQITWLATAPLVAAAGRPSEAWSAFKRHY